MVELQDVWLRYGPEAEGWALSGLSFALPEASLTWLIGPSGAGKSSLLRLLHLQLHATRGAVRVMGEDPARLPRRARPALRRRIGTVFQDYRLLPHLSVFENAALPLRIQGVAEARLRADVAELLGWVGLARRAGDRPETLSGGEQQRLAIARAVVGRPRLLVADEPTGNLDAEQARRVLALLGELHRMGTTVVVATHSEALLDEMPAPVLQLDQGRIAGFG
jgi:cell division transport system ATP-binding protein